MRYLRRFAVAVFFTVLACGAAPVSAATSLKDAVRAELISAAATIAPGSEFAVAVRLRMDPEWHTYWKNPGDGGMATQIEWQLPPGFTAGEIEWPAPHKFETSEIVNYGYSGEVLLVTAIRAPENLAPGSTARVAAKVSWLGCKNICVPGRAALELSLPAGPAISPSGGAPLIAAARASVPPPLSGWNARAWRDGTTLFLELRSATAPKNRLNELYFYPEDEQVVEYAAPQHLERVKGLYVLRLELSSAAPSTPKNLRGVLAGREGWTGSAGESFSVNVPVEPAKK